jgi:hypothetical protein
MDVDFVKYGECLADSYFVSFKIFRCYKKMNVVNGVSKSKNRYYGLDVTAKS